MADDEHKLLVGDVMAALGKIASAAFKSPVWQRAGELESAIRVIAERSRSGEMKININTPVDIDPQDLAREIAWHMGSKPKSGDEAKAGRDIYVRPEDMLHFLQGAEPVSAGMLVRIIANASATSGNLSEYIKGIIRPRAGGTNAGDRLNPSLQTTLTHMGAARNVQTLRDSLHSLAKLCGGYAFVDTRTPDWMDPEGKGNDPDFDDLRLAEVYQQVKALRARVGSLENDKDLSDSLDSILDYIKEGEGKHG